MRPGCYNHCEYTKYLLPTSVIATHFAWREGNRARDRLSVQEILQQLHT